MTRGTHAARAVKTLIVGIGNSHRGDDALGLEAAKQLEAPGMDDIDVVAVDSADPLALIEIMRGRESVVLIDGIRSGAKPGSLHRIDASSEGIPALLGASSSHTTGVAQAIELARSLDCLPARVIVHGIEVAQVDVGANVSPSCQASLPALIRAVKEEARCMRCR